MKRLLIGGVGLFLFLLFFIPFPVRAEEFALTKIGALSVNGKYYAHWWYEPTHLTLEGTGSKGANIDISVDGNVSTIKASVEDGSWKYTHEGELEKTDHNITVGSGGKEISFILTVGAGSVPADQQPQETNMLPETGSVLSLMGIVLIAGVLLYYGFREKLI